MPPKPRMRIPTSPSPKSARKPPQSASPSQPSPKPRTPPPRTSTPWYRAPTLGTAARWSSTYIVLLCGVLFVRDTYLSYDKVTGASMAPTMNPRTHETGQRDWILVRPFAWRLSPKPRRDVQRGDVVTFWKPQKPEEMGIKRVVAVEGDEVWPRTGYVVEAGERGVLAGIPDGLADHDEDSIVGERREGGSVVVPYGHVWVEGDNWRESWDSRHYGPISKGLLLGRAVGIWRGWGEFMRVGDGREKKEKKMASRIVEGKMEAPQVFLE